MHGGEEIHGVGTWVLRPLAMDQGPWAGTRSLTGATTGTLKLIFLSNLGPGSPLPPCFLIPMTLEMCLSGSEGRESILGGGRGAVSEVINSSPDHHLLAL